MESPSTEHIRPAPAVVNIGMPLFCLLVTTVFLGVCLDPFTPVKNYMLRLMVTAGLLAWLHRSIADGRITIVRTTLDYRIAALAAWTGLSGLWAVNRPMWSHQWTLLLCGVALYYLTVFYFRERHRIETLLGFMIAPVFVMLPFGVTDLLGRSYFPWDRLIVNKYINLFDYLGVAGQLPPSWLNNFSGRISTTFGNPVYLAGWLTMMLPVTWVYYRESKSAARRVFSLSALMTMLFLLTATFTRSAWLSAAASFIVLAALLRGKGRPPASIVPGLAAMALAGMALTGAFAARGALNPTDFNIRERLQSLSAPGADDSMLERTLIWKTSIEMILDNPAIGVGYGNYEAHHPRYQVKFFQDSFWRDHTSFPDRVHNEYLDIWAETGAAGLGLMLLLILGAARTGFSALKRGGPDARLVAGIMAGSFALLLYANAQFPLHVVSIGSYLWILAGMLGALGGGLEEKIIGIRTESSRRESSLAAISLSAIFLLCAWNFTKPVTGNAAYLWGVYTAPMKDDNLEKAKIAMEKGMDAEPGSLELAVRYGNALNMAAGKGLDPDFNRYLYREVLGESLRGLKYHPFESRLFLNAGTAYLKLDQPAMAVKMLENAVVFDPKDPLVFYNLGIAQYLTGLYNNATINYYRALSLGGGFPGLYQNLGMVCMRTKRYPEALAAFNKAIEIQGESKETYNSLGRVHSEMRRSAEAVSNYRRALSIAPDYADARGNLAIELIAMGDFAGAALELEKVLEQQPGSGIARYHLGRAYHLMGRDEDAAAELEQAVRLMPEPGDAETLLKTVSGGIPQQ